MTIEEIIARYDAGQINNLNNEVAYIMDDPSQGELAALNFARSLEEAQGSSAQLANLAYDAINNYKLGNALKINQQAILASELKKAQDMADKNAASAISKGIADNVLNQNNTAIATPVTNPTNPLILNPDRIDANPVGAGGMIKGETPTDLSGGYVYPEFVKNASRLPNTTMLLYVGSLLVVLYFVFKK